jgi:hypothetical protein
MSLNPFLRAKTVIKNTKRNQGWNKNRGVHNSFFGLWSPLKIILAGEIFQLNIKLKSLAQKMTRIHKTCWSSHNFHKVLLPMCYLLHPAYDLYIASIDGLTGQYQSLMAVHYTHTFIIVDLCWPVIIGDTLHTTINQHQLNQLMVVHDHWWQVRIWTYILVPTINDRSGSLMVIWWSTPLMSNQCWCQLVLHHWWPRSSECVCTLIDDRAIEWSCELERCVMSMYAINRRSSPATWVMMRWHQNISIGEPDVNVSGGSLLVS